MTERNKRRLENFFEMIKNRGQNIFGGTQAEPVQTEESDVALMASHIRQRVTGEADMSATEGHRSQPDHDIDRNIGFRAQEDVDNFHKLFGQASENMITEKGEGAFHHYLRKLFMTNDTDDAHKKLTDAIKGLDDDGKEAITIGFGGLAGVGISSYMTDFAPHVGCYEVKIFAETDNQMTFTKNGEIHVAMTGKESDTEQLLLGAGTNPLHHLFGAEVGLHGYTEHSAQLRTQGYVRQKMDSGTHHGVTIAFPDHKLDDFFSALDQNKVDDVKENAHIIQTQSGTDDSAATHVAFEAELRDYYDETADITEGYGHNMRASPATYRVRLEALRSSKYTNTIYHENGKTVISEKQNGFTGEWEHDLRSMTVYRNEVGELDAPWYGTGHGGRIYGAEVEFEHHEDRLNERSHNGSIFQRLADYFGARWTGRLTGAPVRVVQEYDNNDNLLSTKEMSKVLYGRNLAHQPAGTPLGILREFLAERTPVSEEVAKQLFECSKRGNIELTVHTENGALTHIEAVNTEA